MIASRPLALAHPLRSRPARMSESSQLEIRSLISQQDSLVTELGGMTTQAKYSKC